MASTNFDLAVLYRHRTSLLRELNDSDLLSILVKRGIISTEDEESISNARDPDKKCDNFIEVVSKKGLSSFSEFCTVIEKECPCFVKEVLNERFLHSQTEAQLAETFKSSMVIDYNLNRESSSPQCRRSISRGSSVTPVPSSRRCSLSPDGGPPILNRTIELYTEPVVEDEEGGGGGASVGGSGSGGAGWETARVSVSRVPGYGFGIAVSGGRDNPHFANGDPSIAVSDVLKAGPAEDLLQVNDRIISVNGVSLENVEYATAVQVLRDSGNTVSLTVRRRAPPPAPSAMPSTVRVTLTKQSKKEDFGLVLGCRLFIKELTPRARSQLSPAGQGLCEGDVLTRINGTACGDVMTLKEARKIVDSCKEKLSLTVLRETRQPVQTNNNNTGGFHEQGYHNNYGSEALNSYSGQNLYVAPPSRSTLIGDPAGGGGTPQGAGSGGLGSTGRSRGPLPVSHESPPPASPLHPPRPPPPRPEDYYSSRRQLYEEDPLSQRNKPASEPRLISFQKEGSVGLRLTGGNQAGIFVSAVQPGSPASLQGLTPGDNILKVNEMEMKGVTREEAVLFLLSLQEQIDLIVQHSPEEYQSIATQHRGDSFHIKCHFHYGEATKGEMSFRSGDVFHVVDTLHNGTVGAWQVYRIGRNNSEVQKGIIPNKARAEELATAQFNATKKELTTGSSESRGSFFRRRRSTHRRSKSLGKEHWDDVVFSDSISKFPAYERVVLKHPGFVRPVVLFGPIADLAREKLLRDYPDKFTAPQLDSTMEDGKSKSTSGIIRLSGIRAIMDRGKHALLDITPNAVDRLNYAQFYPIVIFLKADSKHIIKQLRQGIPKSAHKSSKKLLEQCQRMDRVWGHVFTQTVTLSEATLNSWYSKLNEHIQRCQAQQLWISETKRSEPISDDFLFPMSTPNESRLSYASSPESDAEVGTEAHGPRLLRASSDPSVATDTMERDSMALGEMVAAPPPYTSGYGDSKYGFSSNGGAGGPMQGQGPGSGQNGTSADGDSNPYSMAPMMHSPPQSPQGMYGHDLPPRIDRGVKPPGGVLLPGPLPGRNPPTLRHHSQSNSRPSAQERLFGTPRGGEGENGNGGSNGGTNNGVGGPPGERQSSNTQGSLDRHRHLNNTNSYDSMSSYDSYAPSGLAATALALASARLGPNAPDDLKVNPRPNSNKYESSGVVSPPQRMSGGSLDATGAPYGSGTNGPYSPGTNGPYGTNNGPYGPGGGYVSRGPPDVSTPPRGAPPAQPRPQNQNSEYSKYSTNRNSTGPSDYQGSVGKAGGAALYKPVPPPKPKHYRPPAVADQPPPAPHHAKSYSQGNGTMEMMNGGRPSHMPSVNHNSLMLASPPLQQQQQGGGVGSPNGFHHPQGGRGGPGWPSGVSHAHSHSHPAAVAPPYHPAPHAHQQSMYGGQGPPQSPPYTGPPPHLRSPPHATSPHVIDLAGSREQRGSAFELYRKPQHMHNISPAEDDMIEAYDKDGRMTPKDANSTPKPRKKLSKKASFLKNFALDLFRTKSAKKLAKHQSMCESDLAERQKSVSLRREKSDLTGDKINGKSKGLFRSNSTCEKKMPLKPILKRQSSFSENHRVNTAVRDFLESEGPTVLKRQNSLGEIETEPKIKPMLRRQNSLIEYNRRGALDYQFKHFNMITAIDPLYQRRQETKHEAFYPNRTDIYQTKNETMYGVVPKPERTYATRSEVIKTESPYGMRQDVIVRETECPYASRQEVMNHQTVMMNAQRKSQEPVYARREELNQSRSVESPYGTRRDAVSMQQREEIYSTKRDCCLQGAKENPYGSVVRSETVYSTRDEVVMRDKQRMLSQSHYSTKEEMLRQRLAGESPYATKDDMLKQRCGSENPYGTREDLVRQRTCRENPYGTKEDIMKQRGCGENPYGTREDLLRQRARKESAYATREDVLKQRAMGENPYGTRENVMKQRCLGSENPYGTREDVLRQRCNIESPYGTKADALKSKMIQENPYSTKEDMLKQRLSTEPYKVKEGMLKHRLHPENPYGSREQMLRQKQALDCSYKLIDDMVQKRLSGDMSSSMENRRKTSCSDSSYSSRDESNLFKINSEGSRSRNTSVVNENPYASQEEVLDQNIANVNHSSIHNAATMRLAESPYASKSDMDVEKMKSHSSNLHVKPLVETSESRFSPLRQMSPMTEKQPCICEDISSSIHNPCSSFSSSKESTYVSKQEILMQKAASQAIREARSPTDDKFEVIRLRNQAKKEKIYQSRREIIALDGGTSREPIYATKRDLKETVIYETNNDVRDQSNSLKKERNDDIRCSPYELSDIAHLSRRESLYQTKQEALNQNANAIHHSGIDFDTLRISQPKTDQEKQSNLTMEANILKGEPIYQSRLPPKAKYVSEENNQAPTFNSVTSMETHYESECSMQFNNMPQSTPYASQDIERANDTVIPVFKCNNKSQKLSGDSSGEGHDTTVISTAPPSIDPELLAIGQKGRIGSPEGPCTTWGIFGSDGGFLEDRAWGVSLLIPPDAILPGVKQKVYFTVTDPRNGRATGGPPIDMDKGEALLSPLVMCGPQGLGFARPVTLRLPHCANTLPSLGLALQATDTEQRAATAWDHILLPATTTLNTVAVKVDHF